MTLDTLQDVHILKIGLGIRLIVMEGIFDLIQRKFYFQCYFYININVVKSIWILNSQIFSAYIGIYQ